jgi:cytochrome c oxidase subunit 2
MPARADWALNLQPPVTSIAQEIYDLHSLILLICLAIFVSVFGTLFFALFRHRKSLGHAAHHFHENAVVEVVWTIIPFLILGAMAWPATKTILNQKDTRDPDLTIKITGHQWKWEYDYLQDGVKFLSLLATPQDQIDNKSPKDSHYLLEVDEPMVVPVDKKVRLLMTGGDVIHSWWVPALGVKQDAIPGFIRDAWFRANQIGIFRGQCAELCGQGHAFMPIMVEVKSQPDYERWLAAKKGKLALAASSSGKTMGLTELRTLGQKVFAGNCAACHQLDGKGIPGVFPALDGDKVVNGSKADHITTVLQGRLGTPMPAFGPQLSDMDIAAVLTYERNAWSNHAEAVQPAEVKALRK